MLQSMICEKRGPVCASRSFGPDKIMLESCSADNVSV
jgi:hypothetical protein